MSVSIIIPSYNRLWSLPKAVESCRNTKCKTQIIVVDDGSTDGTWDWLQTQRDVEAYRQCNQGQTYAVNFGSRHVREKYVRFLDSDDYLMPGTIDAQYEIAEASQADVVVGRVDILNGEGDPVKEFKDPLRWDDFMAVMLGEGYGSHLLGFLLKHSFVSDIPRRPDYAMREDRMFLLELALKQPRVAFSPGLAGCWIQHSSQMHTTYDSLKVTIAAWQMWKMYEKTIGVLKSTGELTPRRALAAANVLWPTAHEISRTHINEGGKVAAFIKSIAPSFVPPESKLLSTLYNTLGYSKTQRILRFRRILLGK